MLTTQQRAQYLPLAMRVFGVIWSLIGTTFVLTPTLARWHPYNTAYEHMFAALFVTWGILLLYHFRVIRMPLPEATKRRVYDGE